MGRRCRVGPRIISIRGAEPTVAQCHDATHASGKDQAGCPPNKPRSFESHGLPNGLRGPTPSAKIKWERIKNDGTTLPARLQEKLRGPHGPTGQPENGARAWFLASLVSCPLICC